MKEVDDILNNHKPFDAALKLAELCRRQDTKIRDLVERLTARENPSESAGWDRYVDDAVMIRRSHDDYLAEIRHDGLSAKWTLVYYEAPMWSVSGEAPDPNGAYRAIQVLLAAHGHEVELPEWGES